MPEILHFIESVLKMTEIPYISKITPSTVSTVARLCQRRQDPVLVRWDGGVSFSGTPQLYYNFRALHNPPRAISDTHTHTHDIYCSGRPRTDMVLGLRTSYIALLGPRRAAAALVPPPTTAAARTCAKPAQTPACWLGRIGVPSELDPSTWSPLSSHTSGLPPNIRTAPLHIYCSGRARVDMLRAPRAPLLLVHEIRHHHLLGCHLLYLSIA